MKNQNGWNGEGGVMNKPKPIKPDTTLLELLKAGWEVEHNSGDVIWEIVPFAGDISLFREGALVSTYPLTAEGLQQAIERMNLPLG